MLDYFVNLIASLPAPALVFLGLVALVSVAVNVWGFRQFGVGRDEIRAALAHDGYTVREIELRWLTRGPFAEMRMMGSRTGGERLYYVVADDPAGRRLTGWVRYRLRGPWHADQPRWSVRWNDAGAAERKGLTTAQFSVLMLVLFGIVLWLISRFWSLVPPP